MKNPNTFKSLPTYGQIESGLFHKPAVIKSVCPYCESKRWKWYSKNIKQCLTCKTHYGQTVL